ncbi:MAG: hypothetical protein AB1649_13030, partial [Chloroflexota bacterium]
MIIFPVSMRVLGGRGWFHRIQQYKMSRAFVRVDGVNGHCPDWDKRNECENSFSAHSIPRLTLENFTWSR